MVDSAAAVVILFSQKHPQSAQEKLSKGCVGACLVASTVSNSL